MTKRGEIDGEALWRAKQSKAEHAKNVRRALWTLGLCAVGLLLLFTLVRCAIQ